MRPPHTILSVNELWLTIFLMGLVTFGLRLFFLALFGKREIPPLLKRALRFVPSAVLTALVLPDLLYRANAIDLTLGNHRLIAGAIAALAAWRTRNVAVTIVVGLAVLIACNALMR